MAGATTQLEYIPDHRDRARADLPSQFRDKPHIEAAIAAWAKAVQTFEDLLWGVLQARHLDTATGHQLEQLAALVGEARGGLLDGELRRFVRAKIASRRARNAAAFIELWQLVTQSTDTELLHLYPAHYQLQAVVPDWPRDLLIERISAFMDAVRPGGIGADHVLATPAYFGFDDDPDALGYDAGALSERI